MLREEDIILQQYRICRLLGNGGMGNVYLAEDIIDGTRWAVKIGEFDEKNHALLRSEVEIQVKLNHPALPKIRQSFEDDHSLYIIMEYVEGQTLEELLKKNGFIPEQTVIRWFLQICDVLVYLHGRETPIVYRDLKPSNIMVQPSGDIKIIDFGIAQEYRQNQKLDKAVMALTRGYAAPEQYDSRYLADVRTDIYALGVTVHYMLTGKNPNTPPFHFSPVRKLNLAISYAMEYIVKKCIQPNPDKRYKNAIELQNELNHIQALEELLKKKRGKKIAGAVAGAVGVICIAVATFFSVNIYRVNTISEYYTNLEQAQNDVNRGDFEDALQKYEEAIETQPEAWEAYLGVADIYLKQGKYEECYECLKGAADKFPNLFENKQFLEIMDKLYENYDR